MVLRTIRIAYAIIIAVLCGVSTAQVQSDPINLDVSIGVEHDSNVTVSDIDFASGLDDIAFLFRAKTAIKHDISKQITTKASYVFSAKDYDKFSQFDQNHHLATLDVARNVGRMKFGVTGRYLQASLDGDEYITAKQLSPYLSRYFGRKNFLRVNYTFSDRQYKTRPERDGDTQRFGIDGYHFLQGTRQFLILSYRYEDVDAFEQQLAYDKHRIQAAYIRRFPIHGGDTTLRFSARYESRDYKAINFVINDIRSDDRFTYGAAWKLPIYSNTYLELDVKYRDYQSNLNLVDYKKTVFGIKVGNVF